MPAQGFSAPGLSPRTRGRRLRGRRGARHRGSIPANAGETPAPPCRRRRRRVYPRERGGDPPRAAPTHTYTGLSPRTRGRPEAELDELPCRGSIPANAGETRSGAAPPPVRGVYPRERGGDHHQPHDQRPARGLSPRTRGRRGERLGEQTTHGSIPANAGETDLAWRRRTEHRVYPRERGGDVAENRPLYSDLGLSPRTRGRPAHSVVAAQRTGSIPANAGETR